jgi:DNA-binding transcriptional ArsR family regulator
MKATDSTPRSDDSTADSSRSANSDPQGVLGAHSSEPDASQQLPASELLTLLNDDYVCEIIAALDAEPLSVRELVRECDLSRPTAYRRLNRLEDAGLVESTPYIGKNATRNTQYQLRLSTAEFRITAEGVAGDVALRGP